VDGGVGFGVEDAAAQRFIEAYFANLRRVEAGDKKPLPPLNP
jgi:hypothetical protein